MNYRLKSSCFSVSLLFWFCLPTLINSLYTTCQKHQMDKVGSCLVNAAENLAAERPDMSPRSRGENKTELRGERALDLWREYSSKLMLVSLMWLRVWCVNRQLCASMFTYQLYKEMIQYVVVVYSLFCYPQVAERTDLKMYQKQTGRKLRQQNTNTETDAWKIHCM